VEASYETYIAVKDGKAMAAFGISTHGDLNEVGVPWLLATPEIKSISREFLRTSKQFVERWILYHDVLTNAVDLRHHEAHRWLLWLGFKAVAKHSHFGVTKEPFIQFNYV